MSDPGTAEHDPSWYRLTVLAVVAALLVSGVGLPAAAASAVTSSDTATAASANFAVTIDSTNSPVREGETLHVGATVENTGSNTGTQTINLTIADRVQNSTSLTLDPGENESIVLSVETADGDAGTYNATIASENDSATTEVVVKGNQQFVVQIDSTNSPVAENESVNVTATIVNIGDGEGTQNVTLEIDGNVTDHQTVTLGPDEHTDVTLRWQTAPGDAGEHNATVASDNHSDSTDVTVLDPGNFSVRIDSTNSPVFAGERLRVNATVTNLDDAAQTKAVSLSVGGAVRDSRSVALGSGETANLSLTWATGAGDAGTYTATVSSPNASDSTNVTVRSPPGDARIVDGGTFFIGQVLFTDAFGPNETVELRRADGTVAEEFGVGSEGVLALETADRATGTYRLVGPNETDLGFDLRVQTYTVGPTTSAVKASGDNTTVTFTVRSNRSGYRHVVTSPKIDGEALDGIFTGVDGIPRDVDGDGTAEALVLPNGANEQSVVADFAGVDPGTYTIAFDVPDTNASDAVAVTVTVNDPPTAVIQQVDATVGEEVTIAPQISTDSPIERYEWRVDGEVVARSETLTYTFSEPGEHRLTLTVTDDAGSTATAARAIEVSAPTATPTETPTPTDGSGPGFGLVAALVALVLGIFLGRRS